MNDRSIANILIYKMEKALKQIEYYKNIKDWDSKTKNILIESCQQDYKKYASFIFGENYE